jgi:peroxiredoxin
MKIELLIIILSFPFTLLSQEITEENYIKADNEIWEIYDRESTNAVEFINIHPEKKDSMKVILNQIYESAQKMNSDTAIKYATVPSGLKRLFMVRLSLSKDTLQSILNSLPSKMQESDYGKSLLLHLKTRQLEKGDLYHDFEAFDSNGSEFRLSMIKSKYILLVYGGLGCMGENGRDFLNNLYIETNRTGLEIVTYWEGSNTEELKEIKELFSLKYIIVSDFLQDLSPVKITYGTQATPTCFLIDENRNIVIKSVGLPEGRLTKLKEESKFN